MARSNMYTYYFLSFRMKHTLLRVIVPFSQCIIMWLKVIIDLLELSTDNKHMLYGQYRLQKLF